MHAIATEADRFGRFGSNLVQRRRDAKKNSRSIRCFKKLSPSKMSENQAAGQDIDAQGEKIELDYDQVVL
jgi:hypothetical protein